MQLKPYEIKTTNTWRAVSAPMIEWTQYKNVPIHLLHETKALLKSKGLKFRVRYRGPRNLFQDKRSYGQRMQDCAKQFANRFTVYIEN